MSDLITRKIVPTGALPGSDVKRPLVVFRVGAQLFGIDAAVVKGATRQMDFTPAPLAEYGIVGISMRNEDIMAVMDVRVRLNMPPRADSVTPSVLLVQHNGDHYALLVDKIEDVITLTANEFSPTPVTIASEWKSITSAIVEHPRGLIAVINVANTFHIEA